MAKKKKAGGPSSVLGLAFILLSLTCDGIVGGLQKKLKVGTGKAKLVLSFFPPSLPPSRPRSLARSLARSCSRPPPPRVVRRRSRTISCSGRTSS